MYICNKCGHTFWEEQVGYEPGGYDYDGSTFCPECGGDYQEAIECLNCGEYIPSDSDALICADCQEEAKSVMYHAFMSLSEEQRSFLENITSGQFLKDAFSNNN